MSRALASTDSGRRCTERGVKMGWRMRRRRVCRGWSMFSIIWRKMDQAVLGERRQEGAAGLGGEPLLVAVDLADEGVRGDDPEAGAVDELEHRGVAGTRAAGGSRCQAMPPCGAEPVERLVRRAVPERRAAHRQVAVHDAGRQAGARRGRRGGGGPRGGGGAHPPRVPERSRCMLRRWARHARWRSSPGADPASGPRWGSCSRARAWRWPSSTSTRPPPGRRRPSWPAGSTCPRPRCGWTSATPARSPRPPGGSQRSWAGATCCAPTWACSSSGPSTTSPTTTGASCSTSTSSGPCARSGPSCPCSGPGTGGGASCSRRRPACSPRGSAWPPTRPPSSR